MLVDTEVVVVLVGPSPLDTAVVLGVVEAGNSVEKTRVDNTTRDGSEFSRSVLAPGDLALVPESPLSARVPSKVTALSTHEDVVVNIIVLVGQREEVRDFKVESVGSGLEQRAECLVGSRLPESTKEGPVGQVGLRSGVEWDTSTTVFTLDAGAEHHVPVRLFLAQDSIHLGPWLNERITPASHVPALRVIRDNWVSLILLPGLAAIVGDDNGLLLSSIDVRKSPIGREILHRGVEGNKRTVLAASKVVRLSRTAEDAETVVG